MKGLSLIQPWATLLAIGAKQFETRGWATKFRGPIAIHASRRTPAALEMCETAPYRSLLIGNGYDAGINLPFGAIIAVAELLAIHPTSTSPRWLERLSDQERSLGDFSDGRIAWEFRDMRLLPEPIPARGMPGLWEADLDALRRALPPVQQCRVCGCTDDDCSGCVEQTGMPCYWVEADLCSACGEAPR